MEKLVWYDKRSNADPGVIFPRELQVLLYTLIMVSIGMLILINSTSQFPASSFQLFAAQ